MAFTEAEFGDLHRERRPIHIGALAVLYRGWPLGGTGGVGSIECRCRDAEVCVQLLTSMVGTALASSSVAFPIVSAAAVLINCKHSDEARVAGAMGRTMDNVCLMWC